MRPPPLPPSTDQRPSASEETMLICSRHGGSTTTTITLRFILGLALLLLCPLGMVTVQGESQTQSPAQVLQDLLDRYGDNSTITVPQLRSLLAVLSQGQGDGDNDSSNVAETPTSTPPKANSSKVGGKKRCYLILCWHLELISWYKKCK